MSTAPKMAPHPSTIEGADSAPEAPTHAEIAALAYHHWESRGKPIGSPDEDWFRAEQDLLIERLIWGQTGRAPRPSRKTLTS